VRPKPKKTFLFVCANLITHLMKVIDLKIHFQAIVLHTLQASFWIYILPANFIITA